MAELIPSVREILATTPGRWGELTARVELALLERRPAPGEWSALECLQHLLDTEVGAFSIRLVALREGRDFENFDPDVSGFRPEPGSAPAAVAAQFTAARARTLKTLDGFSEADLELTARHSELGVVTLRELINEWAAHDLMHTVQGERALMQPFIDGSGKWRVYFSDHDIHVKG